MTESSELQNNDIFYVTSNKLNRNFRKEIAIWNVTVLMN